MLNCLIIQIPELNVSVSVYSTDWHGTVSLVRYEVLELTKMVGAMAQPIKNGVPQLVDMFKDSSYINRHASMRTFGQLAQYGK
jgi:hypothetical protein